MSVIEDFYNTTATNTRKTTGNATASDAVVTVSSFLCVIRPIMDTSKLYVESNIGKEYALTCPYTTDIKVGDRVTADKVYTVLGVPKYEDLEDGSDGHIKVRVVAGE